MKKPKRHLMMAIFLIALIIFFTFLRFIDWRFSIIFLIALFPYLSFSIFFAGERQQKKREAIDIIRKYPIK